MWGCPPGKKLDASFLMLESSSVPGLMALGAYRTNKIIFSNSVPTMQLSDNLFILLSFL
jgi:hypothetical protein